MQALELSRLQTVVHGDEIDVGSSFLLRGQWTVEVRMLAESWEYTASDRFLHCLPLHHILNHLKFQFYFCSSDINIEALPYPKGFDFP
jgi:hypothetical protein